jgi:hypothetical protein
MNPSEPRPMRPETERTLPTGRVCDNCGASLDARRPQARFCSARCRTATRRKSRQDRIALALEAVSKAVTALTHELSPGTSRWSEWPVDQKSNDEMTNTGHRDRKEKTL